MAERPRRYNRGVKLRGETGNNCDQFIPDARKIGKALQKLIANGLQQEILTQEKLAQIAHTLGSQFNYKIGCQLLDPFTALPAGHQALSRQLNFIDRAGNRYSFYIAANKPGEFLVVVRQVE